MTIESTRADLLSLVHGHRDIHDGGYQLASALCDYRNQMPDSAVKEWEEVLLAWVRDEPARLWGVALEALARAGGRRVGDELTAMLGARGSSEEWREYVANTLIRLGCTNSDLIKQIEEAAQRMTPMGLPNLAALLIHVPEQLTCAVTCIVAALSAGKSRYIKANVPPFVLAAADSDPELLVRLVQQTHAEDREAGRQLGEMIAEHLREPFVERRFPEGVSAQIERRVQEAVAH
jgi:hypothetical protein